MLPQIQKSVAQCLNLWKAQVGTFIVILYPTLNDVTNIRLAHR